MYNKTTTLYEYTTTIVAIATPPGRGGIGIVRLSGTKAYKIAIKMSHFNILQPRYAHYGNFFNNDNNIIDKGLILYFPRPYSFTGEDVIEFHCHGGPIVLDLLVNRCLELGSIQASPGEFSERAFMNDKMDLTQAEGISDLISACSIQAAQNALRSIQGDFSKRVNSIVDKLLNIIMHIETHIEFYEESEKEKKCEKSTIIKGLNKLQNELLIIQNDAFQGVVLKDGITVVITGAPNAGKSSLLNALVGIDTSIVTDIAGTTRDLIRENIYIDNIPFHLIDTAGLRNNINNKVEQIGAEKALKAINEADHILLVVDGTKVESKNPFLMGPPNPHKNKLTIIVNKSDLSGAKIEIKTNKDGYNIINISAKTFQGIPLLRTHLTKTVGYNKNIYSGFSARRRHLESLRLASMFIKKSINNLINNVNIELVAEELHNAKTSLGEITGKVTSADLLKRIFSSFCIGK